MGLFLEHFPQISKAGGLSFGMLIAPGRLHIMPISKSTYFNCAVFDKVSKIL